MHRIFWKDSRQLLKVVASRERGLLTGGKENIEARLLLSSFYIMCVRPHSVAVFATPRTVAPQPASMGLILQAGRLEWVAVSSSRGSSRARNGI